GMQDEDLVGRADRMDVVLATGLAEIAARHPIVGDVRSLGLYGVIELVEDAESRKPLVPWNGSPESQGPVKRLARGAYARGLHVATRWNYLFVAPPPCVTESQLRWGLDVLDGPIGEIAGGGGAQLRPPPPPPARRPPPPP